MARCLISENFKSNVDVEEELLISREKQNFQIKSWENDLRK